MAVVFIEGYLRRLAAWQAVWLLGRLTGTAKGVLLAPIGMDGEGGGSPVVLDAGDLSSFRHREQSGGIYLYAGRAPPKRD